MLVFPTVEGPRFLKGYTFCAVNSFVLVLVTYLVVRPYARALERKFESAQRSEEEVVGSEEEVSDENDVTNKGVTVTTQVVK